MARSRVLFRDLKHWSHWWYPVSLQNNGWLLLFIYRKMFMYSIYTLVYIYDYICIWSNIRTMFTTQRTISNPSAKHRRFGCLQKTSYSEKAMTNKVEIEIHDLSKTETSFRKMFQKQDTGQTTSSSITVEACCKSDVRGHPLACVTHSERIALPPL